MNSHLYKPSSSLWVSNIIRWPVGTEMLILPLNASFGYAIFQISAVTNVASAIGLHWSLEFAQILHSKNVSINSGFHLNPWHGILTREPTKLGSIASITEANNAN